MDLVSVWNLGESFGQKYSEIPLHPSGSFVVHLFSDAFCTYLQMCSQQKTDRDLLRLSQNTFEERESFVTYLFLLLRVWRSYRFKFYNV